ncbi:hypothetical protein [Roseococcus pinisoli]|uniref:Uncharacterized protein n=1 Tax=Roseococcus pinisoli TaxID=2835040 RepID=A0ABS5QH55_9PROT|nr:hypothetical protein [Roseococcus pinisoli]MBS7812285.1 hypothetical protein [Roseococcus pinisoli]
MTPVIYPGVPPIPDSVPGMRSVSKEEFYSTVGPMNVHPSVVNPAFSSWETPNREVMGRSYPGWKHSGLPGTPRAYFVKDTLRPPADALSEAKKLLGAAAKAVLLKEEAAS